VAKLLTGFEVRILYADPIRAPAEIEQALRAEHVPFETVIAEADIVSLHLPLTKDTAGMFGAEVIAAMKPGAVLVNCARGGLVDGAALHDLLVHGHIAASAIDTFATEPARESPLFALEQTILTPHTAGGTIDNFRTVVKRGVDNATRFLAGQTLSPQELVAGSARDAA
jgi:D-3-phosphoglycerate dehydrogenase